MNRLSRFRFTKRLGMALLLAYVSLYASAQNNTSFNIPAQALIDALISFSEQSGVDVLSGKSVTEDQQTEGFIGEGDPETVLLELLDGTGLTYRRDGNVFVIVTPVKSEVKTDVRVEEVYVTARRREESVQDIPIAISAFTAADLKEAGIRNLSDMEGIVPGLNMGGGGNGVKKDSNPFIRGVGQRETKVTLDPAVGTYVDGIYLARTAGAMLDTIGVERIEVLRGPQGTLFGKNTTGGAISITTKKPSPEFGASVSVNVGNYGRSDASFMVNAPLTDNLFGRFTLGAKNSEGYFTNVVDNTKWGDDNRVTGIGQLRWLPTDSLMFDLLAERTRIRETPRPQKCAVARPIDNTGSSDPNAPNYNPNRFVPAPISIVDSTRTYGDSGLPTFSDLCEQSASLPSDKFASDFAEGNTVMEQGRYWVDTSTVGLTGAWDVGQLGGLENVQLKSISSWRKVEQIADEDLDGVNGTYLFRVQPDFNENRQISQEIQFSASAMDERLFISTGLYYFQEKTPHDDLIRTAGIASRSVPQLRGSSPTGEIYYSTVLEPTFERLKTDNKSYSWYGQLDYDLTPQIQLTAGLRYTNEERWTEYSKAYAYESSIVLNNADADVVCDYECSGIRSWEPAVLASIMDWEFEPLGGSRSKDLSTRDEAWTPMISIKYQANDALLDRLHIDDAMLYATYSEGFHSGGVTAGAIDEEEFDGISRPMENPITFKPEKVQNYELGLKLQAFEQRVQANMAVFYMDYTDMQVTSTGSKAGIPIPFVDNVGKAAIHGFEGEFVFQPTMNWRLLANLAYTDADMKEWNATAYELPLPFITPQVVRTTLVRDDEPMPRVPRWTAFLLTDYTFNLSDGGYITPSVAARYTSEIYHGFDRGSFLYGKDMVTSDAVTFIDARVSYLSADERLEVALWGKNLTDKDDYLVGGIPLVDVTGAMGQVYANPRTFGLEVTYRFGAE